MRWQEDARCGIARSAVRRLSFVFSRSRAFVIALDAIAVLPCGCPWLMCVMRRQYAILGLFGFVVNAAGFFGASRNKTARATRPTNRITQQMELSVLAELSHDLELVSQTRASKGAAFDALFHRHKQSVFNVCFGILGSHEDASDAAQVTFIKAFGAMNRFRGDSSFHTWLFCIARNVCIETIRKRKVRKECVLDVDIASAEKPCDDRVWEALHDLAPDTRAVLVLAYFHGLSGRELAAALGCSEPAARVRLSRARKLFKDRYEEVVK